MIAHVSQVERKKFLCSVTEYVLKDSKRNDDVREELSIFSVNENNRPPP